MYLPKPLYEAKPYIFIIFGFLISLFMEDKLFTILGGVIFITAGIHIGERLIARQHN